MARAGWPRACFRRGQCHLADWGGQAGQVGTLLSHSKSYDCHWLLAFWVPRSRVRSDRKLPLAQPFIWSWGSRTLTLERMCQYHLDGPPPAGIKHRFPMLSPFSSQWITPPPNQVSQHPCLLRSFSSFFTWGRGLRPPIWMLKPRALHTKTC